LGEWGQKLTVKKRIIGAFENDKDYAIIVEICIGLPCFRAPFQMGDFATGLIEQSSHLTLAKHFLLPSNLP
jgi:hypothetical protein